VAELVAHLRSVCRDFPYGEGQVFRALKDVDIELREGEIRGLVGPSGSGKTTLLHILGLIDKPTSGKFEFLGRDVAGFDDRKLTECRAEAISFMFQENYLIPHFTATENVILPMVQLGRLPSDAKARAEILLERLGLGPHARKRVSNLSGGQRQRVCIARALFKAPRLIIADEPSASLDSTTTAEILRIFFEIRDSEGCAIIVATHDQVVIERLSGNLLTIHDGRMQ